MSDSDPSALGAGEQWRGSMHLRERIRERGSDAVAAHRHTALTDSADAETLLSAMIQAYSPQAAARAANNAEPGDAEPYAPEDFPATAEETAAYRKLIENESTTSLGKAVHEGDAQTQAYAVGDPGSTSNIEGLDAIEWIQETMDRAAPIIYIFGPPGSGKTNLGVLLARIWRRQKGEGALLGSNVRTLDDGDKWIPSFASLESWLGENTVERDDGGIVQADDAEPRLMMFDEASSHASGRGEDGHHAGRLLGPLVYKIRKARAGLIIIGHDGRDVHPAVRTLATCVEKRRGERKTARFFEDVRDRQGLGHIETLTGIPRAGGYDDQEATGWSWDEQEDREDESRLTMDEAESLAEDMVEQEVRALGVALAQDEHVDATQGEIGRAVGLAYRGEPYRQNTVSTWITNAERDEPADLPATREDDS